VRIEQSSGLNAAEIERMRKEAQEHAEEDKKAKELAEARNQADSMCWQLEKLLKEHDAKLGAKDKEAISGAIAKTREAAKSSDAERIKSAVRDLEQASHALSKILYEATATAAPGAGPGAPGAAPSGGAKPAGSGPDDEAIDAEFEVKD